MNSQWTAVWMSCLISMLAGAATLWQADFEPPAYTLGALVPQQGWWQWSGTDPGHVATSYGAITPPQGTQFAYVAGDATPSIYGTSNFVAQFAAVNTSTEFIQVSYKLYATFDNNVGFYTGADSTFLIHQSGGLATLTWNGGAQLGACPFGQWNDIAYLIDPAGTVWNTMWVSVNGNRYAVNAAFSKDGAPDRFRMRPYAGTASDTFAFDAIVMSSVPAGPALVPATPLLFIGTFTRSGAARIVNAGRPGSYSWSASSPNAWLTINPAFTNGSTSAASVDIPFTVNKSLLSLGDTNGTLVVNCGAYGILTYTITVRKGATPAAIANVAGLHLTQINPNASQEKYYQDTMIRDTTPHAAFDGGMMDVGVIRGFYCFGNTAFASDPYLAPFLLDGPAQTVVKGAFITSNTVYALDTNVYPVLNPAVDNGSAPSIAGTLANFISSAALTKRELAMPLLEGTNQFTLLATAAGEIGTEGMLGLFVYGGNETPDFVDGELPTLAAVDDGTGYIEAEWLYACGYHGTDVTYFQKATEMLTGTTLAKEINGYVVRITYFNLAGRNDVAVNPNGMNPPGCVGHVCPYLDSDYNNQWAIRNGGDHAIAYLEIVVSQPPPVPAALVTNLVVGIWDTGVIARVYNNGTSNFSYTATSDVPWLKLAAGFATGVVTSYRDLPLLANRAGLSNGLHFGHVTLDCGALVPSQLVYNVRLHTGNAGVVNVYGVHITETFANMDGNKKYEDTMFAEATPPAAFNENIDVAVLDGLWCFGNYGVTSQAPWTTGLLTDGPAQYLDKGSFQPASTNVPNVVKALNPAVYSILNPITDNGTAPVVSGSLANYITDRQVGKNQLFMPLQEGVNHFTILLGPLGEIEDQGMAGLFVFASNQPPVFAPGSLPTLAGFDENAESGVVDANGFESCGFIAGDAGYTQKATNYFTAGTLTNQVGDYVVMLTQFDLVGPDTVNLPFGMTGPDCPGNVCEYLESDFNSQWAIRPAGGQYLGYVELQVALVPEPGLLGGLLLAAWRLRRARQQ